MSAHGHMSCAHKDRSRPFHQYRYGHCRSGGLRPWISRSAQSGEYEGGFLVDFSKLLQESGDFELEFVPITDLKYAYMRVRASVRARGRVCMCVRACMHVRVSVRAHACSLERTQARMLARMLARHMHVQTNMRCEANKLRT